MAPSCEACVFQGMTTLNAFAFLVLGVVMFFVPGIWPEHFVPNPMTGGNTSALWLQCMAPIQAALGVRFIFLNEILPLWQMAGTWHLAMEWHPVVESEPVTV
jgi:hypothetical protein